MATKSYTDIPQSEKLEEILSLESADMVIWGKDLDSVTATDAQKFIIGLKDRKMNFLPCWSLAALLDVLPNNENISINLSKGGYRISTLEYTNNWFVDYEDETNGLNNCVTSADNPIDACVEMIMHLNKLNLL